MGKEESPEAQREECGDVKSIYRRVKGAFTPGKEKMEEWALKRETLGGLYREQARTCYAEKDNQTVRKCLDEARPYLLQATHGLFPGRDAKIVDRRLHQYTLDADRKMIGEEFLRCVKGLG